MDDIDYLGYIANHYNEIKHCVDLESIKTFGHESNEDIFHDTILKCMSCSGKLLSESQIKNYIFISYKTNFKRELDYARNKNRDEDVELQDLDELDFDRSLIDYNTIKNLVINLEKRSGCYLRILFMVALFKIFVKSVRRKVCIIDLIRLKLM